MTKNQKLLIIFIVILTTVTLTTWFALVLSFINMHDAIYVFRSLSDISILPIPSPVDIARRDSIFSTVIAFTLLGTHCATSYFLTKKIIVLKGRIKAEKNAVGATDTPPPQQNPSPQD